MPIALYKIVYDAKKAEAYAFILPNRDHDGKSDAAAWTYLDGFRVTVATVESATGLKFFNALPADKHDKAVSQCTAGSLWAP